MATIHFVDGEKGGVGKSLFARVLLQYFSDRQISFTLVDADPKGDVHLACGGREIVFSEAETKIYDADELFQLAMSQPVIVNLPSNVSEALNGWIERNQILKLGASYGVKVVKWFVCSGQQESLDEVAASLKYWKNTIPHVLVRNQIKFSDWSEVEETEPLKSAISEWTVQKVDLSVLSRRERDYLETNRIPFSKIAEHKKELGVLGLMRVQGFLDEAFASIDKIWEQVGSIVTPASAASSEASVSSANGGRSTKSSAQDPEPAAVVEGV